MLIWGLLLAVSAVLSLILILLSFEELSSAVPQHSLWQELSHPVACMVHRLAPAYGSAGGCDVKEKVDLGTINRKIHALPDFQKGVFQILAVVAVSWLWFSTFKLKSFKDRTLRYKASAFIVTVMFIFGMFPSYQPAVFVAALVAIFVAAEHYHSLSTQTEQLNAMLDKVVHIANSTQLSLNTAGLAIFMEKVYGAYSRADTVHAIVRDHSIEVEWWAMANAEYKSASTTTDKSVSGVAPTRSPAIDNDWLKSVWDQYKTDREATKPKRKLTVFHALTEARDIKVVDVDSGQCHYKKQRGVSAAFFVSSMPLPGSSEWLDYVKEDRQAKLFEDLLGLAWECINLDEVREFLGLDDSIGEWISRPLSWMHATDREVWQVIKREELSDSNVLAVADLSEDRSNMMDRVMSRKTIELSQSEIRLYVQRGVPAQEYLCSVLCFAMTESSGTNVDGQPSQIAFALEKLGLSQWLDLPENMPDREACKAVCVGIFVDFIRRFAQKQVSRIEERPPGPKSSLILARGIL
ncbi:hypothetical protein B0G76_7454 [Paraburkholderia sp. BL23I1N1]|uniref:hypothetical protein n=1 Tax=Paraburkholderia sp. BL23I1N1 TaxID=1938802 RepID=UPI000E71F20B|nr:hypothetical protein [Paraburkholderia sp. BL23I1N1]RKE25889.1 hypothetical protein B0G76_7454 [Paraburkholderia sp. BL23I1N1]